MGYGILSCAWPTAKPTMPNAINGRVSDICRREAVMRPATQNAAITPPMPNAPTIVPAHDDVWPKACASAYPS